MEQHQVEVAAESLAASLMSQAGWDVLVRYGANLPEYDIVAVKSNITLKVSSKGSQVGSWGLTQSYKKGHSHSQAADIWARKHSANTVVLLVQFQNVQLGQMPRVYLASPKEIAERLKSARDGHGETILHENHTYKSGIAKGVTDSIPESWRFSDRRLREVIKLLAV
jgi:Holliday junction resolvase-like predicted endonuclease